MRKFARSHWKILIAVLLAIALATLTLETDSAPAGPTLQARLRAHVQAIAAGDKAGARHIEATLQGYGYRLHREESHAGGRKLRTIEATLSNTAPGAKPERIFIVGAHDEASDKGSALAAVLELARVLKDMQPSRGTEVKFVFFANVEAQNEEPAASRHARDQASPTLEPAGWYAQTQNRQHLPPVAEPPYPSAGSFIAFVGTLESSARVRQALAAFRAQPDFPSEGLAAPAHVMGVTLSDHSGYARQGYPALMITDTAFLRYPYYHTAGDTPDKRDYASMARVVEGLARTIASLAGGTRT